MTQEDKDLLIKDLSGRLPYGVKIDKTLYGAITLNERNIESFRKGFDDILIPYLHPLSSMTDEQYNEFFSYYHNIEMDEIKASGDYLKASYLGENAKRDWLNKNHFDYNYLIDRNLAIDCTNLNIY